MDLLIDLDGTMTDPQAGIIASVQYALRELDRPIPEAAALHWVIGPPLRDSFPKLGVSTADIEHALVLYRRNYTGKGAVAGSRQATHPAMYDATAYAGVSVVLDQLRATGRRLIVCTSKPHIYAKPILQHFKLAQYFQAIHGSELDGRNDDKADLIAHIIRTEGVDPANAIMIGDRKFDILGAKANGLPSIGVLWGYGSPDELTAAGATRLCDTPDDLPQCIAAVAARR
jgi:phosphoglycolate phosphatase